jgi:hypothetical protein
MRVIKFVLTIVFAVAGIVLLADQRAAAGEGIPLKALEGNYSFTTPGSYSICLDPKTFAGVDCATFSGPLVVPFTYVAVGALTRDGNGNSCGTWSEVSSVPVSNALPLTPPIVSVGTHAVGKISTYDPATGTGDINFTNYSGGKCNGSTFDITGATETATTAAHFAVSHDGKRLDLVFTSAIGFVTDTTGNIFGDFSFSSIVLKQEN